MGSGVGIDIQLRWNPFDWEVHIWEEFKATLDEVILDEAMGDILIWSLLALGRYSCQSFKKEMGRSFPLILICKVCGQLWLQSRSKHSCGF